MNTQVAADHGPNRLTDIYATLVARLDAVPWEVVVIPMRVAAFSVFWRSGSVKIADWSSTVELFRSEYRVPVLPPEIAAYLAASVELGCSTLILLGLATRFAALAVVGMIAVIQVFVYPSAWPDHIQWLAFLLPLIVWGAGRVSLDGLIARALVRAAS